jgi:hypothetical protein
MTTAQPRCRKCARFNRWVNSSHIGGCLNIQLSTQIERGPPPAKASSLLSVQPLAQRSNCRSPVRSITTSVLSGVTVAVIRCGCLVWPNPV